MLQNGWADKPLPQERLFDLLYDPQEMHNLAYEPEYADALKLMRERLHTWMVETQDPILNGPVLAPKGAEINTPDQTSPNDPTVTV
jgi:hypothetical protein